MKKILPCVLNVLLFASFSAQAQERNLATVDLDAEWKHLLAERSYDEVIDDYDPVFEVEQNAATEIDKEKCTKQYPALKTSVSKVPVSAALAYWAYRCAEVAGTAQEAEKYLEHFSRIAKYSFAQASDEGIANPIRVINQTDLFSLLAATEMPIVEQYIDTSDMGRFMRWNVVLWDEKDQRERSYSFDFLEFVSNGSSKELGATRAYRLGTARGLIRTYAKAEWDAAQDALAVIESQSAGDTNARIEKLKPQVLRNGRSSSTQMFVLCIESKDRSCGQTLVDGMLDALEAKQSSAMVRMAALYSAGIGVKQDADASIAMLKAAEKRTGDKGFALHDFMFLQFKKDQLNAMPQKIMDYLERESFLPSKSKAAPAFVYMQMRKMSNLPALKRYGAKLEASALAGVEDSYELFAVYQDDIGNAEQYRRWIEKAARAGHAFSQRYYALELLESKTKADREKAFDWMLEAARNGNLDAIIVIANEYYSQQRWQEAAVWYETASNEGDLDSALKLASIYARAPKGTDYSEQDAVDIYKTLSEDRDSAIARRQWARLLMFGKTLKHDVVKARELMLQDADKKDSDSMAMLGAALLSGQLGAADEKAGMAWLEKAELAGNAEAANTLATYLYYKNGDQASLDRAKILWQRASQKKHAPSINNYAWSLCTSAYPAYVNAKAGLALFALIGVERLAPSHRDSYASCLAADGDFKTAIAQQQLVIKEMKARGFEKDEAMAGMALRLSLYEKNKTFTEPVKTMTP